MKKITFIRTAMIAVVMAFVFVTEGLGQAALPFSYDLGRPTAVTGLTHTGLGTDYASTPKMKFDTAGDNLILNFSGTPGTLSFSIKWNQSSAATRFPGDFNLLESDNGTIYTTVQLYNSTTGTALPNGTAKTESFSSLKSTTRYLKWDYTAKTNGNIAIGAISLSSAAVTPVVTASQSYTPTVGVPFSQQIAASNSPTSYALASGSFPAGLSMSIGGLVTGTPTAVGLSSPTITATNGSGTSPAVAVDFTVGIGSQLITFGLLSNKYTTDIDYTISATASSALGVSFSSSNTAVATVTGTTVHIVGAGSTTITAAQAGDANWNAATSVDRTLTVTAPAAPQTITFDALSHGTYGSTYSDLSASSTSGLSVTFASDNSTVATVTTGGVVTIVGPGTTTITATQAGDLSYNAATPVTQDLIVDVKPLTVTTPAVTTKTYTGTNAAVITGTLTGIVGLDVVTLVGTGTFADVNVNTGVAVTSTSTLSGANAAKYSLTQPTGMTGDITKANQLITFTAIPAKVSTDAPFALVASSNSGLPITFGSLNEAIATVSGSTVTIVAAGNTTITASQVGDGNYNAATTENQALSVSEPPILAWQFGSPASLGSEVTYNATTNNSNLDASVLSRGVGINATALGRSFGANTFSATGTKSSAVSENEYFQFTVTPKIGSKVSLSTLDATIRRSSATAPNAYIWKYSLDGSTFTEIGTDVSYTGTTEGIAQPQIDLSGISALQNVMGGTTISFRLYAWGGTSTSATFSIGRYVTNNTTNSLSLGGSCVVIILDTPVALTPSRNWKHNASVDWVAIAGAQSYIVDLYTKPSGVITPYGSSPYTIYGTDSLFTGLPYDQYYYTVKAKNVSYTTVASNEMGFLVDLATPISTPSSTTAIYSANGRVNVSGKADFAVYNTQGMQVAVVKATEDVSSVALRPGIYVVKTAGKVQKVVVR